MMTAPVSVELAHVLTQERVIVLASADKSSLLNRLVDILADAKEITDLEDLRSGIFHREKLMSTGIGLGIGVPHVRQKSVQGLVMAVAVVHQPVSDYESLDDLPVQVVFMIAAGEKQHVDHIRMLAAISSRFKDRRRFADLLACKTAEEAYEMLIRKKD